MEINLGGIKLTKPANKPQRISLLLWGDPGCGKTTLAATAPGVKLWINFDPDGTVALNNRDDVLVMDLAGEPEKIVDSFLKDDPLKISTFFNDHPEVETVVIDSVSEFAMRALMHGVTKIHNKIGPQPTFEEPGQQGYGRRLNITYKMVHNMLKITSKYNKHIIFITHEKEVSGKDGVLKYISLRLGGTLNTDVPLQLSETWHMQDTPKNGRLITIRPYGLHKPMKTRMFSIKNNARFKWLFDSDTLKGDGIDIWYKQWKANQWKKILPPNNMK